MLDNYIDVATRLQELKRAYPNSKLQPFNPAQPYKIEHIGEDTFIVYVAACYLDENDNMPGVGMAWEKYPGHGMTRGSELMIAETSAWGRAIVAATMMATKNIASADEVKAAQERQRTTYKGPSLAGKTGGAAMARDIVREMHRQDVDAEVVTQEIDPWTGLPVDVVAEPPQEEIAQVTCTHGDMIFTGGGLSKAGKKLPRWTCPETERSRQCKAVW
jgi:hypothetical protein